MKKFYIIPKIYVKHLMLTQLCAASNQKIPIDEENETDPGLIDG